MEYIYIPLSAVKILHCLPGCGQPDWQSSTVERNFNRKFSLCQKLFYCLAFLLTDTQNFQNRHCQKNKAPGPIRNGRGQIDDKCILCFSIQRSIIDRF